MQTTNAIESPKAKVGEKSCRFPFCGRECVKHRIDELGEQLTHVFCNRHRCFGVWLQKWILKGLIPPVTASKIKFITFTIEGIMTEVRIIMHEYPNALLYFGVSGDPEQRMPQHESTAPSNQYPKIISAAYVLIKSDYTSTLMSENLIYEAMMREFPTRLINKMPGGSGVDFESRTCYLYCIFDREGETRVGDKQIGTKVRTIKWIDPMNELRKKIQDAGIEIKFGSTISVSQFMSEAFDITIGAYHAESEQRAYICQFLNCGKSFATQYAFSKHNHDVKPRFYCDYDNCTRSYAYNYDLTQHKQKDHNESKKETKCDLCPMNIARGKMLFHQREHHAELLTFKCDTCHSMFLTQPQLTDHLRNHD